MERLALLKKPSVVEFLSVFQLGVADCGVPQPRKSLLPKALPDRAPEKILACGVLDSCA